MLLLLPVVAVIKTCITSFDDEFDQYHVMVTNLHYRKRVLIAALSNTPTCTHYKDYFC